MDAIQLFGMEEIVGQVKWTTTNHTKGWSSSKGGNVVYIVWLKGSPLFWAPSGKQNKKLIPASIALS